MANWSNPTLLSNYVDFVDEVKNRDIDAAKGFDPATTTATNVPVDTIRWSSSANTWQKWNGTTWNALSAGYAINITGNAATATVLQTGRTINGTSFNGSANITTANWGTSRTLTLGNTGKAVNGGGDVSWSLAEIGAVPSTGATGAAAVPAGTTAQRPGAPAVGQFRFNSTLTRFEGYNGTAWGAVGGGATGGGTDDVFVENGQQVNTSYTITANKNAMSAGPITIASGVTVTVPSGSNWAIV